MKTICALSATAISLATLANANPDYMTEIDANAVLGSDFIGKTIYTAVDAQNPDREAIGEVDEIIFGLDGTIDAILLDIGGFMGVAEHSIAVAPEMVSIKPDFTTRNDVTDTILVVTSTEEQLREIPAFSWVETTMPAVAPFDPKNPSAGYATQTVKDVTAAELAGAPVYDLQGEWVGEVSQLMIYADSNVSTAIVDVGGFFGLGEKPVELDTDKLIILRPTADDPLEVRLTTTAEELEKMPEYQG